MSKMKNTLYYFLQDRVSDKPVISEFTFTGIPRENVKITYNRNTRTFKFFGTSKTREYLYYVEIPKGRYDVDSAKFSLENGVLLFEIDSVKDEIKTFEIN